MLRRRWRPAKLRDRNGEDFITLGARVWRTTSQNTSTGQRYDYRGVCDQAAAPVLAARQNMILEFVEGESYRIIDAIHHEHLGYVELQAVQNRNQG